MPEDDFDLLPEERMTLEAYNQNGRQWAIDHNDPGFWEEEMRLFHQLLPSGHVLEIGAGGGRDARELLALGYQYTGTDISTRLLEFARQQLPDQNFLEQSVYELHFDHVFDGFWASAVLLHIPRIRIGQALHRIRLALRHGSIGFISIKDGIGASVEVVQSEDGQDYFTFSTYWDRKAFESVLLEASFELVHYAYRNLSAKDNWHIFFVRAV